MLTRKHQKAYDLFYESTHENEFLDQKTEILIGLSASIAMSCKPCTNYYLKQAKKANIRKGEISEVLAKVMAVSAGQKRLQMKDVLTEYNINLESY